MSEKELFEQLFNVQPSPAKPREEEAKDFLSSLLAAPAPQTQPKKKKKEEEVHEYVRLAEKTSDKAKKHVQKWKEEQTMTPEQIRQKRTFEKVTEQFQKAKKLAPIVPPPSITHTSGSSEKKVYMPKLINPFEKPEKPTAAKPKPTPTAPKKEEKRDDREKDREKEKEKERERVEKKERQEREEREREEKEEKEEKERVAKAEAKQEKIRRKEAEQAAEKERAEKAAAASAAKAEPKEERQKPRKESSSSSSSSSGSSPPSEKYDWRAELRSITKYNPSDEKFRRLDKEKIKESGIDRIFGEDRFSSRWGRLEEEEDLRREMRMKRKERERHQKHHHRH